CYAVKANSNQAVLATLARLGAGMDIVSEGELRRALAAKVPAERIVFSGIGKTKDEMAAGLDAGILCFNVESEPELEALAELARDLLAEGHALRHLDLGGGLGIPYRDDDPPPPEPHSYAAIIKRHTQGLGLNLIFEIGRMIAGNAGILVMRVVYVKQGEGK